MIPHRCLQSFTFTKDKQLRSLRLPVVLTGGNGEVVKPLKTESAGDRETVGLVKSPVMMPSTGRHEYGERVIIMLSQYHGIETGCYFESNLRVLSHTTGMQFWYDAHFAVYIQRC